MDSTIWASWVMTVDTTSFEFLWSNHVTHVWLCFVKCLHLNYLKGICARGAGRGLWNGLTWSWDENVLADRGILHSHKLPLCFCLYHVGAKLAKFKVNPERSISIKLCIHVPTVLHPQRMCWSNNSLQHIKNTYSMRNVCTHVNVYTLFVTRNLAGKGNTYFCCGGALIPREAAKKVRKDGRHCDWSFVVRLLLLMPKLRICM